MSCDYIYNLASGIWEEIGSPTSQSINYISGWLVNNVGTLNNRINTCYSGDGSGCIDPAIDIEEQGIYKEIYKLNYYTLMVTSSIGAAALSTWVELKDDVSSIRRISPNEFAKVYLQLKKEANAELNELIFDYQRNHATVGVINMGVPWEGPTPVPAYVDNNNRSNNYFN